MSVAVLALLFLGLVVLVAGHRPVRLEEEPEPFELLTRRERERRDGA